MTWTKDLPEWNMGTRDVQLAEYETKATRLAQKIYAGNVLDVGAGSGYWSKKLFKAATRIDLVASPENDVEKGDVRSLKYGDGHFNTVHSRRVISNLDAKERTKGLKELWRVTRNTLFLVDVFTEQHANIQQARAEIGLPPLGKPSQGKGPLSLSEVIGAIGFAPQENLPIAGSYYFWTRVTLPKLLDRPAQDVPYNWVNLRSAYPTLTYEAQDKYAVHRLLIFNRF